MKMQNCNTDCPKESRFPTKVFLRGTKTFVFCHNSVTYHKNFIHLGEYRCCQERKGDKHVISVTGIPDIAVLVGKDLWRSMIQFTGL